MLNSYMNSYICLPCLPCLPVRAASQGAVQRILVVDLDVHQGNGVERDKLAAGDQDLFILDVYNRNAFPWDQQAKAAINVRVSN